MTFSAANFGNKKYFEKYKSHKNKKSQHPALEWVECFDIEMAKITRYAEVKNKKKT